MHVGHEAVMQHEAVMHIIHVMMDDAWHVVGMAAMQCIVRQQ